MLCAVLMYVLQYAGPHLRRSLTRWQMYLGLARGHFLSPSGGCKPFDEAADGYCRAEGCAVFVLKRLSDAIAEKDHILGVIRDVVVNQSGNAHSITHPHSETQTDLFRKLLQRNDVSPGSIDVVEAHGTGTQVFRPLNDRHYMRLEFSVIMLFEPSECKIDIANHDCLSF